MVLAPEAPEPLLPDLGTPVRVTRDREPYGGPLHGLAAGIAAVREPVALLAAADMPALRPAVLQALLDALAEGGADAAALALGGGPRPFPCALRVAALRAPIERLVSSGERRARTALESVRVAWVPEEVWRALDPEAGWTRDVDRPEDLPREA